MRTDVDVLFIGGPLDDYEHPVEQLLNPETGELHRPDAIPFGSEPVMTIGPVTVALVSPQQLHGESLRTSVPMVGSGPLLGTYMPMGITDHGMLAYVWLDA